MERVEEILKKLDEMAFDEFCDIYGKSIARTRMIPDLCIGILNMGNGNMIERIKERFGVEYIHVCEIDTVTAPDTTGKEHIFMVFAQRMRKERELTVIFRCSKCLALNRLGNLKHKEYEDKEEKKIHVFSCPECGRVFTEFYEEY